MSRARDLSRLSNPTNFTPIASNGRVGLGSTNPTAKLNVVGVVSATAFYGDGSNLEGVASAGLGTAVEAGSAFGGEQIYFTNTVLSIGGTGFPFILPSRHCLHVLALSCICTRFPFTR